jgi:hypothetical protein
VNPVTYSSGSIKGEEFLDYFSFSKMPLFHEITQLSDIYKNAGFLFPLSSRRQEETSP